MPPRIPLVVLLAASLPSAATAQVSTLSLIDVRGAIRTRVDSLCTNDGPLSQGAGNAELCRRALAFTARWTPASRGFPPATASAAEAALQAAALAVESTPTDGPRTDLLAALTLELTDWSYRIRGPAALEEFRDALWPAITAGVRSPIALRACVGLSLAVNDPPTARFCADKALRSGADSTWHMLRLAWLDLITADSAAAFADFAAAVDASTDTVMEAELAQFLSQFFAYRPAPDVRHPPSVTSVIVQRWQGVPVEQRLPDILRLLGNADTTRADPAHQRLFDEMATWRYGGNDFVSCPLAVGGQAVQQVRRRCADRAFDPPGYKRPVVAATLAALWHPVTGKPGMMVIGSVGSQQGDPSLQRVTIRTWVGKVGTFRDTSFAVSAGDSCGGNSRATCVTAWLDDQAMPTSWSFATAGSGRVRGRFLGTPPPPHPAPHLLSSLLLGQRSDSMTWRAGDELVTVSADNTFGRDEPVELYFQVQSETERTARVRIVIEQLDRDATTQASSTIASEIALHPGLNHVARTLELSRLPKGPARVRLELSLDGVTWIEREAGFELR